MANHRSIWKKHYGEIPKDKNGRSLEIHHINGKHTDNDINNLKMVTIEEHLQIHLENLDFGACGLIMKRMGLPSTYMSDIQKGKKRPGIGGAKKGTIPWNKGKGGYKLNTNRKGRRPINSKIFKFSKEQIKEIRRQHDERYYYSEYINELANRKENGIGAPILTYERFLSKIIRDNYYNSLTAVSVYNIIMRKTWKDV